MVYENSAETTRKVHTIVFRNEPTKLEFKLILKSTSVELLSTCRFINNEADAIVQRQIAKILISPVRMVLAFDEV